MTSFCVRSIRSLSIVWPLCVIVVLSLFSTPLNADPCVSTAYQPHSHGVHNFQTSSAVESIDGRTQYWTCVRNLDPDNDNNLRIDWYIPGPHIAWIPGDTQHNHPRTSMDSNFRPIDGNIEYGYLNDITIAEFLGDADDARRAPGGPGKCCSSVTRFRDRLANEHSFSTLRNGWSDSFRIFFPTDTTSAAATMMQLDANMSISLHNDNNRIITTNVTYSVQPFDGRQGGNPGLIRYILRFPRSEQTLANIVYEQLSDRPIVLGDSGEITFIIQQSDVYRIAPMALWLLAPNNQVVGVLEASVLSPVFQ